MKLVHLKFFLGLACLIVCIYCSGQAVQKDSFESIFMNISEKPEALSYSNKLEVNNNGGHLQGVQCIKAKGNDYVLISGSSDLHAYHVVVKLGSGNEVISVNKLFKKPFKHSGGIQIFENFLAIGIEDNSEKDKSKVCIYDISDPENPDLSPVAIIERQGKPYRSTAGCVGLTKHGKKAVLVVGDWDTKNIDIYTCPFNLIKDNTFELIYSIDTEKIAKDNWTDKSWHSYQNINLITNNNDLYLIGMGQNEKQKNIADLYKLTEANTGEFQLLKLASKTFRCKNKTSFKAGAGVYQDKNGNPGIITCTYDVDHISHLNFFNQQ